MALPLNLNLGPHNSTEYPFINVLLSGAHSTGIADTSGNFQLNANQLPKTGTLGAQIQGVANVPPGKTDAGTVWVLDWVGNLGTVGAPGFQIGSGVNVTVGSGFVSGVTTSNLNVYGTNGYIEFNFLAQRLSGNITYTFPASRTYDGSLTQLRLYRKDQQSELATSQFDKTWKDAIRTSGASILRFLNWTAGNDSTLAHSSARAPAGGYFFSRDYYPPALWAGKDSTNTNSYAGTLAGATLTHGQTVQIMFGNASTGDCTFALNGGAALPMYSGYQTGTGGGTNDGIPVPVTNGSIAANSIWTLVYDVYLNAWHSQRGGVRQGVPLAHCIALCNELAKDAWINIPVHGDVDLFTSIATDMKNGMNGTTYYEWGNEIWNTSSSAFLNTPYVVGLSRAFGFSTTSNNRSYHGPYALKVATLFPLLTSIYGANSRYKRVLAFAAAMPVGSTATYRLEGADCNPNLSFAGYNACVAAGSIPNVNFNASGNRPYEFCDYLSYAIYYAGAQCRDYSPNYNTPMTSDGPVGYTVGLQGAADDFATGIPANMAKALAWLDWDLRQGTRGGVTGTASLQAYASTSTVNAAPGITGIIPAWNSIAVTYNKQIALYEAAMQASALLQSKCTSLLIDTKYGNITNGNNQITTKGTIQNLLEAYKLSPYFAALIIDQLRQFATNSKSAISSQYQLAAGTVISATGATDIDQWSVYTGDMYSTPTTGMDGLSLASQNKRRMIW